MKKVFTTMKNKGFTLVEFIVIVSIFAIIAGIALLNSSDFRSHVSINNLAHDIALVVRQAQTFGISASEYIQSPSPGQTASYGVTFLADSGAYQEEFILFRDVNQNNIYDPSGGDIDIETIEIQTGDIVKKVCYEYGVGNSACTGANPSDFTITFTRPHPDATLRVGTDVVYHAQIEVQSPQGKKRYVELWNTGQISVLTRSAI